MMGPQDGVDHALRALAACNRMRRDWQAMFVGDGDVLPDMRNSREELGLCGRGRVHGHGRPRDGVVSVLSSADVCLAPEPSNPLNDVSTMIKVGEYMAMGKPIVCYDLPGDARHRRRRRMLRAGRTTSKASRVPGRAARRSGASRRARRDGARRAEQVLAWEHSVPNLLAGYERALTGSAR